MLLGRQGFIDVGQELLQLFTTAIGHQLEPSSFVVWAGPRLPGALAPSGVALPIPTDRPFWASVMVFRLR